jgi:1-aminocyclopropane-1-carboxylate deaminase
MFNLPSPISEVVYPPFSFRLLVKRDDLIHPLISGNKYRKLKYNLIEAKAHNTKGIISFGGVYSNHLHALAAACYHENLPCTAIIRGENHTPHATLDFLRSRHVALHFVSREAYRSKDLHPDIQAIMQLYPNYMLIPEGGSNHLALKGVEETIHEIMVQNVATDFIAVAVGTGATAAGLLKGIQNIHLPTQLLALSALKGNFLKETIATMAGASEKDFIFSDEYCLGGYAKTTNEYLKFLLDFENVSGIEVDPVYNGKLLWGLYALQKKGVLSQKHTVLWIHTGGLQGKAGFENQLNAIRAEMSQISKLQFCRP